MFRMLDQDDIQFNWEEYEGAISEAINASVGSKAMFDSDKKVLEHIYKKLTNPFNSSMQLWVVWKAGWKS